MKTKRKICPICETDWTRKDTEHYLFCPFDAARLPGALDEEEQQGPIPDVTPGGVVKAPVGQGGGECEECLGRGYLTSEVIPGVSNGKPVCWRCYGTKKESPTHEERRAALGAAEVKQTAGVQPWRKRFDELRYAYTLRLECDVPLYSQLDQLDKLREIIESGNGEAVVPDGVAKQLKLTDMAARWMVSPQEVKGHPPCRYLISTDDQHRILFAVSTLLDGCDAYGNSLVGAK